MRLRARRPGKFSPSIFLAGGLCADARRGGGQLKSLPQAARPARAAAKIERDLEYFFQQVPDQRKVCSIPKKQ
jgi:hypothetical protein